MPRDEELPIIRAFYDFVLWLNPKIAKFPRDQRLVMGEYLIRAKYTRECRCVGCISSWLPGTGPACARARRIICAAK